MFGFVGFFSPLFFSSISCFLPLGLFFYKVIAWLVAQSRQAENLDRRENEKHDTISTWVGFCSYASCSYRTTIPALICQDLKLTDGIAVCNLVIGKCHVRRRGGTLQYES